MDSNMFNFDGVLETLIVVCILLGISIAVGGYFLWTHVLSHISIVWN